MGRGMRKNTLFPISIKYVNFHYCNIGEKYINGLYVLIGIKSFDLAKCAAQLATHVRLNYIWRDVRLPCVNGQMCRAYP